jgi:hypothetical protein
LLEVAKDTHDVTSLDTWSRRRITQSMLANNRFGSCLFTPQNTSTIDNRESHSR